MKPGEKETRRIVAERSDGVCEICYGNRGTNMHHRKNASQGGRWTPENIMHLCGSGTTGCHGWVTVNPWMANKLGFSVKRWQDPAEVPIQFGDSQYFLLPDGTREGWTA